MMKSIVFLSACLGALAMSSCIGKLDSASSTKPGTVSQLRVPAGFDWSTTRDVEFKVASAAITHLAVSDTAGGEPFATFFAGGQLASEPVRLSIPAAAQTLYVSYQTKTRAMSTAQAVDVSGGIASFTPGSDTRPFDDTEIEQVGNEIFIPARADGWATMLFEDQWPGYGDFDFNDVVFNYKIQLHLTGDNRVGSLQISLRTKAVGGSIPYQIYLQMHGMKHSSIDRVEITDIRNTRGPGLTLVDPQDAAKDRALFLFEGMRENDNKPANAIWINTEPDYELTDDLLAQMSATVYFKEPVSLEEVSFAGLDFFLAQHDGVEFGPEIHRCNYEPLNINLYYSLVDDPSRRDFFRSKDNLVWAVNIPADVLHAYEKIDFLEAYPQFAAWAQSAGRDAREWYKHGVSKHLVSKK